MLIEFKGMKNEGFRMKKRIGKVKKSVLIFTKRIWTNRCTYSSGFYSERSDFIHKAMRAELENIKRR